MDRFALTWWSAQSAASRRSRPTGNAKSRLTWRSGKAENTRKTVDATLSLQSRNAETSVTTWKTIKAFKSNKTCFACLLPD